MAVLDHRVPAPGIMARTVDTEVSLLQQEPVLVRWLNSVTLESLLSGEISLLVPCIKFNQILLLGRRLRSAEARQQKYRANGDCCALLKPAAVRSLNEQRVPGSSFH